jgi:hypothetical protein
MSRQPPDDDDERPFTLRVAGRTMLLEDAPSEDEGPIAWFEHATVTGDVAWTDEGRDVAFTDIEVDA